MPFGTRLEPIKHSSAFDGPPTIKGDIRIHNGSLYGTTTKELYGNKYNKQIKVDDSVRVRVFVNSCCQCVVKFFFGFGGVRGKRIIVRVVLFAILISG